jgi:O-antigen/teichoic acid export membrane protein
MAVQQRSDFARHVLTLMTGAAVAQLIPILVSPLLTRFYSPEAFGVFSLFVGMAAIMSVVVTGRYELAVMLPEHECDAASIMLLVGALSLMGSIVTYTVFMLFGDKISSILGNSKIEEWLPVLPLLVLLMNVGQVLSYWANRIQAYRIIAHNSVTLQAVSAGTAIGIGATKLVTGNGLIVGRLLGQGVAVLALSWTLRDSVSKHVRSDSALRALNCARKYYQFPLYNMPYSLMGAFSKEFVLLALTAFGFIKYAGFFGLVRSVVYAPAGFVSSTLGQVFFKEAVTAIGSPSLERLALRIMTGLVSLTPIVVLLAVWAPGLFATVFGEPWREAGDYATVFAPAAFLFLFTSWPERVFEASQRQRVSFLIQVVFDCIGMALILLFLYQGASPFQVIAVFSGMQVLFHLVYLYAIFWVGGFARFRYWALVAKIAGVGATTYLYLMGINALVAVMWVKLLAGVVSSVLFAIVLLLRTHAEFFRFANIK